MEILEFGKANQKNLLLIHGFQSPWQIWNPYIEHYKKNYHIIVPILPGHDPDRKEEFVSFAQTAKELEDYCLAHCGEEVYAVYGMSMGGVLAATLWQNKRLKFKNVIFDGSPLVSIPGVMKKMMTLFYLDVTHKSQKRDRRTLENATKSIVAPKYLHDFLRVLDNMSDTTIVNCINDLTAFQLRDDIEVGNTKIYFYHGTAANEMVAKKSAKVVKKYYPNCTVTCFKGKGHCENALLHPDVMIGELDKILM